MTIAPEQHSLNWNIAPDSFTIDFLEFLSSCEIPEMSGVRELQQFLTDYHITEHLGRIGFFDSRMLNGRSSSTDPVVRLYRNNGFMNLTGQPTPWEDVEFDYRYELSFPINNDNTLDTRLFPRADIMKGIHLRRDDILSKVRERANERQNQINDGLIKRPKYRPGVSISEQQLAIDAAVFGIRLRVASDEVLSYYPGEFTRSSLMEPPVPVPEDQKRSHDTTVFIMALQQGLYDLSRFMRERQALQELES